MSLLKCYAEIIMIVYYTVVQLVKHTKLQGV